MHLDRRGKSSLCKAIYETLETYEKQSIYESVPAIVMNYQYITQSNHAGSESVLETTTKAAAESQNATVSLSNSITTAAPEKPATSESAQATRPITAAAQATEAEMVSTTTVAVPLKSLVEKRKETTVSIVSPPPSYAKVSSSASTQPAHINYVTCETNKNLEKQTTKMSPPLADKKTETSVSIVSSPSHSEVLSSASNQPSHTNVLSSRPISNPSCQINYAGSKIKKSATRASNRTKKVPQRSNDFLWPATRESSRYRNITPAPHQI
ncbi:uncharacterized protein LOC124775418 [Schistocerca piceifrons]|uniref:uncharacterized protein LOC124775418 n=1 Tax=Schistocerca piceifrons TaxID=274613 RepID=UPI001F5E6159|nr:uncharacterized protein LOC124775418 [Schistocerca piceifrons]